MFEVAIQKSFQAKQGLPSPIHRANNKPLLPLDKQHDITLTVGVCFSQNQINNKGWFVDTDVLEEYIDKETIFLASRTWTDLFDFRPTFELMSQYVYKKLSHNIPQISYVELSSNDFYSRTRYIGDPKPRLGL